MTGLRHFKVYISCSWRAAGSISYETYDISQNNKNSETTSKQAQSLQDIAESGRLCDASKRLAGSAGAGDGGPCAAGPII